MRSFVPSPSPRALEGAALALAVLAGLAGAAGLLDGAAAAGAAAVALGTALVARAIHTRRRLERARAECALQRRQFEETLETFVKAVESREPVRCGHAHRVRAYVEEVAALLAEQPADVAVEPPVGGGWRDDMATAAFLHDIGKLGVPEPLLRQAEATGDSDDERYRLHALIGANLVRQISFEESVHEAIRHHHERWDGSGYPDGLQGDEIPLGARVIALADVLDELYIARGDRSHPLLETIVEYVSGQSGTRLDPALCELYCQHAAAIERAVADRGLDTEAPITEPVVDDGSSLLDLSRAQHEAGVLYDLACQLGTSLRVEETARTVLHRLTELVPARSCVMYVIDASGMHALPRAALGPLRSQLERRTFARGEGITGWVLETGDAAVNVDPRIDLGDDAEAGGFRARSATVVPVQGSDKMVGLLAFYGAAAGAFTPDHLRIIRSITPQLAAALANAELYETTHTFSMTDSLTQLPNSRFLYAQLDKEIARATRNGQPLVVTVLDLDGFKPVNDRYGHQAGDRVLGQLGWLLQRSFRQGDTVCRYAGDEFVALLPETSPEEADQVVQRVQQLVSEHPFRIDDETSVHVGISVGTACFPLDGSTLEQLIHRADKAMFRDKTSRQSSRASAQR
jgi:diguanylate cyclase (GGDEF)-like protein/putative nucleotidyltransferase with HDIG domain